MAQTRLENFCPLVERACWHTWENWFARISPCCEPCIGSQAKDEGRKPPWSWGWRKGAWCTGNWRGQLQFSVAVQLKTNVSLCFVEERGRKLGNSGAEEECQSVTFNILFILRVNIYFLAPIPGSSRVAGWESSDCRRRGKIAGTECCRSWARATEARDHSSENQGGETPDGAKDAGGRADSSEAGEGVWPEVGFAWAGVLWSLLGCLGGECCFSQLSLGVRDCSWSNTSGLSLLVCSTWGLWLWCTWRSLQRIRYKALEIFSYKDPGCRSVFFSALKRALATSLSEYTSLCTWCVMRLFAFTSTRWWSLVSFQIFENCKPGKFVWNINYPVSVCVFHHAVLTKDAEQCWQRMFNLAIKGLLLVLR